MGTEAEDAAYYQFQMSYWHLKLRFIIEGSY